MQCLELNVRGVLQDGGGRGRGGGAGGGGGFDRGGRGFGGGGRGGGGRFFTPPGRYGQKDSKDLSLNYQWQMEFFRPRHFAGPRAQRNCDGVLCVRICGQWCVSIVIDTFPHKFSNEPFSDTVAFSSDMGRDFGTSRGRGGDRGRGGGGGGGGRGAFRGGPSPGPKGPAMWNRTPRQDFGDRGRGRGFGRGYV